MKSDYSKYILVSLLVSFGVISALLTLIEFSVDFETIDFGFWCAHSERGDYVIQTQPEWDDLWQKTSQSSSEAPDVDFNYNVVLAVYMGERGCSGYVIEILNIGENGAHRRVYIRETMPDDGGLAVMIQPYHIVKLKRIPKEYVFIHTYEVHSTH